MTPNLPAASIPSPGTYIRKRREASGFSIAEIALMVGGKSPAGRGSVKSQLGRLETDEPDDFGPLVDQLVGAFAFDRRLYDALILYRADDRTPVSPICRVCACSYFDPCHDQAGEPCGWATTGTDEPPLCTMCIDDEEPGPAEALPIPANEGGEARDAA